MMTLHSFAWLVYTVFLNQYYYFLLNIIPFEEVRHEIESQLWLTIELFWLFGQVSIALYWLPTIVADARSHHQRLPILFLNLFVGWTFLGWLAALIWSLAATPNKQVVYTTYSAAPGSRAPDTHATERPTRTPPAVVEAFDAETEAAVLRAALAAGAEPDLDDLAAWSRQHVARRLDGGMMILPSGLPDEGGTATHRMQSGC